MKLAEGLNYLKVTKQYVVICQCGQRFLHPENNKRITCPNCKTVSFLKWIKGNINEKS